ncbi:MAG: hypothetical protein K2X69_12975 [Silvanigrellaceae bacterium]|nr:hypothetical protein [Silvanigrellaceae bacterium]
MSTDVVNNQYKKDMIDQQIKKISIEADIFYEKSNIESRQKEIEKNGKNLNLNDYNYFLKRIEMSKLKIEKLQIDLDELNSKNLKEDII